MAGTVYVNMAHSVSETFDMTPLFHLCFPRDLHEYVDSNAVPADADADAVIEARRKSLEAESNPR